MMLQYSIERFKAMSQSFSDPTSARLYSGKEGEISDAVIYVMYWLI